MFERIGRLAEKTADGLSRRSFLTRMGLGALAVATFVTGAHATPRGGCVLNGGCCGANYPYQCGGRCCKNDTGLARYCSACSPSTCCGGGGLL